MARFGTRLAVRLPSGSYEQAARHDSAADVAAEPQAKLSPISKYSRASSPVSGIVTMRSSAVSHGEPSPLLVTRALKILLPRVS